MSFNFSSHHVQQRINLRVQRTLLITSFLVLVGLASATPVDLRTFLNAVQSRPEYLAALATVRAAELDLARAHPSLAFDVNAVSPDTVGVTEPISLSVGVTAYPVVYGQADSVLQLRQIAIEQAHLARKQTLVQLQSAALKSALEVDLSERALRLAQIWVQTATQRLATTRYRYERGVATIREVRDSEVSSRRAQNLRQDAQASLDLAQANLERLVGDLQLKTLPEQVPQGTPASLRNAELALAAAQIGREGGDRLLLPVAELSYNYDTTNHERLSASISSSDLAPRIGFTLYGGGLPAEKGKLSLRVSASISPEQFQAISRLDELVIAAREDLRAARENAEVSERLIINRWAEEKRNRELAIFVFQSAQQTFEEAQQRETLGLGSPLDTLAAAQDLAEAGFGLRDARRSQFAALRELYELYGLSVLEAVTPGAKSRP